VHTELDWGAGLRFGTVADVSVEVETIGRTSFALSFTVPGRSDGLHCAHGPCLGRDRRYRQEIGAAAAA
jgi:acyl-CoA thioesterase FadM